ncbi:hypothetical protein ACH4UM_32950 [Streptomyces sp. NPDC020801]|uniref:hypothetical protein n=1 Tax=unclassified Streptomyces TaxID=2593676 RepID=UPI00379D21DA
MTWIAPRQLGVGLELQLLLDETVVGLDLLEGRLPVLADHDGLEREIASSDAIPRGSMWATGWPR